MEKQNQGAATNYWYKDAIIYELHIKAFSDGNGDGIGDFEGLLQKLDYLQELGVTAIWVLPFYPSPLKDDGYDIADYYNINPSYGTIAQFKQFLEEAHSRNLKVITELVINHTSDQHPWFQRARMAPKGSPERAFYVWSDDPEKYKDVRIIFQDFEASNWTWDPVAQQYYWHRFFHHQPDLNYESPLVQAEILKVLDFWCAMGVDGFRLDAVPYLFEREGTNGENLPETHAYLKQLRSHVDQAFPGTVFLAEANMWPEDSASYFGDGDECHMNYHFPVMPRMFMALQQEDRYPITDIFDQTPDIPESCQWAIFLRNHDELTLEMVTDEERDFMYKAYAKDPKARINLGIRHRLAPLMDNDRKRIELMNALLFSLPGTPVVYYGDEIGMGDNFYLGDRDGVRTPMQWSPDRNAGFSAANPHQLYLPVILDPEYTYEAVNVELQRQNTSSLFWFMKRIIHMRRNFPAFSRGRMQFLPVENPKVLAFIRAFGDEQILVVNNLSKHSQPAEIELEDFAGYVPVEVFSKNKFPAIRQGSPYFFTLSAHSFQWFRLHKEKSETTTAHLPELEIAGQGGLESKTVLQAMERDILPAYFHRRNWFKGDEGATFGVVITEVLPLTMEGDTALLLLAEVTYESGLPETYQVVVSFVPEEAATSFTALTPGAVLAPARRGAQKGLLCDAFYAPAFQRFMMTRLANPNSENGSTGLVFQSGDLIKKFYGDTAQRPAKISVVDENNTSLTYDNKFFLKLYRKVEYGVNPDVEISTYLADQKSFEHIPTPAGLIQLKSRKGQVVLGMVQQLVENHGNGKTYMLDRVSNFIERILARDAKTLNPDERSGSLGAPAPFESLPESTQLLLGARAAGQASLLGTRTAQMHLALSKDPHLKDFVGEEFSLHYQRSLFSSMQSLVRETFQTLYKQLGGLPRAVQEEVEYLTGRKDDLLEILKRIYSKKLDVQKIRVHGNFQLDKVLLTGKDIVIQDFGGNTRRSFSERRLKRSPMRDLADMICSVYYVAFEGIQQSNHVQNEDKGGLAPFAEQWSFYMSSFFLEAYYEASGEGPFLPQAEEDREMFVTTYVLERAIHHLNYELEHRPDYVAAPLGLIRSILGK